MLRARPQTGVRTWCRTACSTSKWSQLCTWAQRTYFWFSKQEFSMVGGYTEGLNKTTKLPKLVVVGGVGRLPGTIQYVQNITRLTLRKEIKIFNKWKIFIHAIEVYLYLIIIFKWCAVRAHVCVSCLKKPQFILLQSDSGAYPLTLMLGMSTLAPSQTMSFFNCSLPIPLIKLHCLLKTFKKTFSISTLRTSTS